MAPQAPSAARAITFMRQCRANLQLRPQPTLTLNHTLIRPVSSSHLAPSNFSKQTRKRDTEIDYPPRFPTNTLARSPSTLPSRPRSTPTTIPSHPIPPGFFSFLKHRVLNIPPPPPPPSKPPPFNVLNNPYRAKKPWPPAFSTMHPKQQFAFEKTFRRRLVIKTDSRRYNWNRYVRLVQQSLIIVTFVYFIFIADPYAKDGGGTPVDGFRAWFFGQVGKLEHLPEGLRVSAGELEGYYKRNWNKAPWSADDEGEGGARQGEGAVKGEGV